MEYTVDDMTCVDRTESTVSESGSLAKRSRKYSVYLSTLEKDRRQSFPIDTKEGAVSAKMRPKYEGYSVYSIPLDEVHK